MELKEFVAQTLTQIMKGVALAKVEATGKHVDFNEDLRPSSI